ncbi:MAG: carboxypeptidase regulatory-like domain-containing protein [Verrucomicrobiae bacterium]|nr:carboxypeptidase regulatory-like domain-containing protein [Verrucomicrobiae bacterium]
MKRIHTLTGKLRSSLVALGLGAVWTASAATFGPNSAMLTHPYGAWRVGTSLTFTGFGDARGIGLSMEALAVETVDGVACLKARSRRSIDADQLSWLAQDTDGNVWQLRTHDGLTGEYHEADVLYLPANPRVGERYFLWDPYFESEYTVISTTATVTTPAGTFQNCLVLRLDDFGDVEEWHLAPGIGPVRLAFSGFENGGWELSRFSGVDPGPAPSRFEVRGTVRTGGVSGTPGVGVTITLTGPGDTTLELSTDGEGGFAFTNLTAGTYTLHVRSDCHEPVPDRVLEVPAVSSLPEVLLIPKPVEVPTIEWVRTGEGVRLRWPASVCGPGFVTESATQVSGPFNPVAREAVLEGAMMSVELPGTSEAVFFRLRSR